MPPNRPITIETMGGRVRKTFHEGVARPGIATDKFRRELDAYRRFEELGTQFTPAMTGYDEDGLWLEIERVADGRTLADWLETAPLNSFEPVLVQLVTTDKYLYENQSSQL